MDFVKNFTGGEGDNLKERKEDSSSGSGGFLGGISNKINAAAGGGRESEKNEDPLDKAVDLVDQHILGKGKQDNESAVEQASDEVKSDYIRKKFEGSTGYKLPFEDK